MNPLDRINQLNAEVGTLTRENALLRSQLHDAQEQAKRDSETIARLARRSGQFCNLLTDIRNAYDETSRHPIAASLLCQVNRIASTIANAHA